MMYFPQFMNTVHGQSRWRFVAFLRVLAGFVYLFICLLIQSQQDSVERQVLVLNADQAKVTV